MICETLRICSMWDDRKNPIEDIEPHTSNVVIINRGKKIEEERNREANDNNTSNAGNPKRICEIASPTMYVMGDTCEATKRSWILYSFL